MSRVNFNSSVYKNRIESEIKNSLFEFEKSTNSFRNLSVPRDFEHYHLLMSMADTVKKETNEIFKVNRFLSRTNNTTNLIFDDIQKNIKKINT